MFNSNETTSICVKKPLVKAREECLLSKVSDSKVGTIFH